MSLCRECAVTLISQIKCFICNFVLNWHCSQTKPGTSSVSPGDKHQAPVVLLIFSLRFHFKYSCNQTAAYVFVLVSPVYS